MSIKKVAMPLRRAKRIYNWTEWLIRLGITVFVVDTVISWFMILAYI